MKLQDQSVWVDEKDLTQDPIFIEQAQAEVHPMSLESVLEDERSSQVESNRRDFLKLLGFGLGAATLASCEVPIKRAIPYTVRPDEIVPGIANYYASTFISGGDVLPVLVKTREGRPIKIEGNSKASWTGGGTSARAQASVLSLYDYNRVQEPATVSGDKIEKLSWADLDKSLMDSFATGAKVRILSHTIVSPTTKKAIAEFTAKYTNTKHICYDPVSSAALLDAAQKCFGERVIPDYKFDQAELIVSFNADFLGTWISPVEYAAQYAKNRTVHAENPKMSRHVQVESHMSLTGSNADNRILVKPSEQSAAIAHLATALGISSVPSLSLNDKAKSALSKLADQLKASAGKSLVVCGNNNLGDQILCFNINQALGNIGKTVSTARASFQRQGSDSDLIGLVKEMQSNQVDVLIVWHANPCFDTPLAKDFSTAMTSVKTRVSFNALMDETASMCTHLAPDHHYLESWSDAEAKRGLYSLVQPTINPLFNTRQAPHSLLVWSASPNINGDSEQAYYDYLRANWTQNILPKAAGASWDLCLHDGVCELPASGTAASFNPSLTEAAAALSKPAGTELELSFTESVGIGAGQYSNNPWLMELADPINRTVWGNYLAVPIKFDGDRRFIAFAEVNENGEMVDLTLAGVKTTIGAVKQFGQMEGTVSIPLGYGRTKAGVCGSDIGTDFFPSLKIENGYVQYYLTDVQVSNSSGKIEKNFACVQHHHTLGVTAVETSTGKTINADEAALVDDAFKPLTKGYQGSLTKRSVLRQTNLKDIKESLEHLQEERKEFQKLNSYTLYPGHEYKYNSGHHWGMHIDLNACIGCGSCAVACMAENNVPVVGKREVSRHHEMTWLRIDRYFYGDVEKPNVVYQPMMCQHCNNAPCENVCPVNATNHSSEGLNQMAYNRCVGTRYCANNCPYKVRRFNWYDFTAADLFPINQHNLNKETDKPYYAENLIRMVLNPDVTVRSRGVIEKCSFCIQRIQEGKLNAKKAERSLNDSDVKTACQTACPTGAITFGDMNNKEGVLTKKLENPLNYIVLEEVNVQSVVNYTMKVNNRDENLYA